MARRRFGGDIAAYTVTLGFGNTALLTGGATWTFHDARVGGSQYTDLADNADGSGPISSVTSSSADPVGSIPVFYGPDNINAMWASANGGARLLLVSNDIGDRVSVLESSGSGSGVPTTRQIITSTGLTGGGSLSADRTLSVLYGTAAGTAAQGNDSRIVGAVQSSRAVSTGTGLTGGGDLSSNRTLSVVPGSTVQQVEVAKNGTLVGARKRVNIVEGANVTATITDNAGADRVDVTIASTGGGGGGSTGTPLVYYVAAVDSTTGEKAKATVVCDGTADDVQIQTAINAMKGVGRVVLAAGTYQLAAVPNLYGDNDVDTEHDHYLSGAGPSNTVLVAADGLFAGLNISRSAKVHISDLRIEVGGATHGIASSYSGVEASGYRSFWGSTFRNLHIAGPWDGSHTGWGMHLGSPFRSVFENIEMGGIGNGLRMYSENDLFNPGDCTFGRMFIDTTGDDMIAYSIDSPHEDGSMNQMNFSMCEGIASGTGCTGIYVGGTGDTPGTSNHNRWWGINLEQFDTLINVESGTGNVFELNYVCLQDGAPGLTAFAFGENAWNNNVRHVAEWQVSASSVLVADGNTVQPQEPNIIERVKILADAGTVTATRNPAGTTILRDIVGEGPGNITAVLRPPGAVAPNVVPTLVDAATIATDASKGNHHRVTLGGNRTLGNPTGMLDGQRVMWELIQDATGGRTITLGSAFTLGTDITAVTLSTAAGKRDFLGAVYNATTAKWTVLAFVKGY